ncbi:hypothetical protein [Burkholderia sp. AW49-1]
MSTKRPTLAAVETLVRYAALMEADQASFHSAINEYVLASPSRRRKLVEAWVTYCERARSGVLDDTP